MDNETEYLIELTRNFLNGDIVELKSIDYAKLCKIAYSNNLLPIVFSVVNVSKNSEIIDDKSRLDLSEHFFSAVYIYETQKNAIENIYSVLSAVGVKHIIFKGSILKEMYPVPETRLMGDIDILIKNSDKQVAKAAMIKSGYACTASNGPVIDFRRGDTLVEMHTSLTGAEEKYSQPFSDAFDNAQFENYCGKLNDNYHFAYLIAHIAHHFTFYGAGIRMILDLAVMLKHCDIDLNVVFELLAKNDLVKFGKVLMTVCYKWYDVGCDYGEDTEKTETFLTSYGVFGTTNRNTSVVIARRQLENKKELSPFKMKLRLLFPSYSDVKNIPYLKFINNQPWLLPYAWIYRIIYNLIHRRNFMDKTIRHLNDNNIEDLAQSELEFFKEIGLK